LRQVNAGTQIACRADRLCVLLKRRGCVDDPVALNTVRAPDPFLHCLLRGSRVSNDSLSCVKTGNIMKQLWRACRETADRQTERLTALKTGNVVKEVCRVCRETAVLETEGLCPDCVRIKAQIRLRF